MRVPRWVKFLMAVASLVVPLFVLPGVLAIIAQCVSAMIIAIWNIRKELKIVIKDYWDWLMERK